MGIEMHAGPVELDRAASPTSLVVTRNGSVEELSFPFEGGGYQFEAAEVQRCLAAGLPESDLVPQATTLEVMNLLDTVREEIGVSY